MCAGSAGGCRCSFLCAGCGNGEGHVAPVYAKWSPALFFAEKSYGFSRFPFKIASGALGASGCPLGVPWVSPWCLLGAPGCVLGASWVPPGCSWVPPWCSWVPPGWSWVPPGFAWVPGSRIYGYIDIWIYGYMDIWIYGSMDISIYE